MSAAIPTAATDPVAGDPVPIAAGPPAAGARLVSLDVFRGITIAAMLLVNNPGSWAHVAGPLRHAEWHGWTPTDLIFPFFLFIVGVAITLAFGSRLRRGASRRELVVKAVKRAVILFGLGLLLHAFPYWGVDYGTLRIPGVLQRIAVAYLAASLVVLYTGPRGQAAAMAALLLGYWALMTLVPVPGHGAGVLTPDGNLAGLVDRRVLGTDHLWAFSRTWDPEGILSTLPAIATVLMGVLAGHWLRSGGGGRAAGAGGADAGAGGRGAALTAGLLAAGAAAVALGVAWGTVFPINKNLWTSSYALFTGGLAALFLAGCYWVVDVKRWRAWTLPFVAFGMNAIAAYFLSGIFARLLNMVPVGGMALKAWLYQNAFVPWAGPLGGSLAFAIAFVLLWLGPVWVLYRRRIFIKV